MLPLIPKIPVWQRRFLRPQQAVDSSLRALGNNQSCACERLLKRDIWLRDVTSRFDNLADGCLYWVNHVDPLAAAASAPDGF